MRYKKLLIFVEGDRDARFFKRIYKPLLDSIYSLVSIQQWRREKKDKILGLIRTTNQNQDNYIFTSDVNNRCIKEKKEELKITFNGLEEEKIMVIVKKIEGWYLAGLNEINSKKIGIECFENTNTVGSGKFNSMAKMKKTNELDLMLEILDIFDFETALQKNLSFKRFFEKTCKNYLPRTNEENI